LVAKTQLNICLTSSELTPLAKSGGLADVCSALSIYLNGRGHDIRVLLPFYSTIDTSTLEITPVEGLQDLELSTGYQTFQYNIDSTQLPGSGLRVYLLRCDELFHGEEMYSGRDEHLRFAFLSRAAIEMCQHMKFAPDVFHCHDWHTALVPLYLKTLYAWDSLFEKTCSVLTIHNIAYQGVFGSDALDDIGLPAYQDRFDQTDLEGGRINFMKTGVRYADFLTTVSPTYAEEILLPEFGMGLDGLLRQRYADLVGILNGVDYTEWNPETDPLIPQRYTTETIAGKKKNKQELIKAFHLDSNEETPIIGMVTRLTWQKGLELVQEAIPELLAQREFSLVVLGSGEKKYENYFNWLHNKFPGRVGFYQGFNNQLAHLVEAGSDLFLMPSRYEPCGLNQMYSLRYGTVPIVRATGGLADSVQHYDSTLGEGTGVVFRDFDAGGLNWAVNFALDLYQNQQDWSQLVRNGMAKDFSWKHQGLAYEELFQSLIDP
jgi:starch synthase